MINLDILGCGSIVFNTHINVIKSLKDFNFNIMGCYDINLERCIKLSKYLRCKCYKNEDELYNSNADLVLVATPPDLHFKQIINSLSSGKNVLCEKPFVLTEEHAIQIINLSNKINKNVLIGHFRRVFPSVNIAKNFLKDKLNNIEYVEASEGFRFNWFTFSNYITNSNSGNVIYDTGSHLLDMVLYILSIDNKNFNIELTKVNKDNHNVTHELHSEILIKFNQNHFPVKLKLSRKKVFNNIIKIKLKDSVVLLNISYDDKIKILYNKKIYFITEKNTEFYYPQNVYDCFALEYLAFNKDIKYADNLKNIFDASNFLSLTKILENLSNY